jgi:flagellar hook-length control protein FliK
MATAVLSLQGMPTPPRGSARPDQAAGTKLADNAANGPVASGGSVTAGSGAPAPLSGFAAAVLAALAAGQPAQGAAGQDVKLQAAGGSADGAVKARGRTKSRRAAADQPAPADDGAPGSGIVPARTAEVPAVSQSAPNPSGRAPTGAATRTDAPAVSASVPSLSDRDEAPTPPSTAHAAHDAPPERSPPANPATAEVRSTPPTMSAAVLAVAAAAAPAQAAATPPHATADAARAAVATTVQVSGALAQFSHPVTGGSATTITLHLAPPALGNVTIRISAPGGATPVVTITTSHPEAADALATARPTLEASLLRAGLPAETRVIVEPPNTPPPGGDTADRGSRHQGGQPRRPPAATRPDTGPDFADALDISA